MYSHGSPEVKRLVAVIDNMLLLAFDEDDAGRAVPRGLELLSNASRVTLGWVFVDVDIHDG